MWLFSSSREVHTSGGSVNVKHHMYKRNRFWNVTNLILYIYRNVKVLVSPWYQIFTGSTEIWTKITYIFDCYNRSVNIIIWYKGFICILPFEMSNENGWCQILSASITTYWWGSSCVDWGTAREFIWKKTE